MRRVLTFTFFFLLLATPVYLSQVNDESVEDDADLNAAESGVEQVVEPLTGAVNDSSLQGTKKSDSTSRNGVKTQRNFRPNKKAKPSAANVVNNGKRTANDKRRNCNGKKGQRKGCGKINSIIYRQRTSLTDEFNQAVDGMLLQLSQIIANDTKKNAFHTRVAYIPNNLRVLPWAYVPLRSNNQTVEVENATHVTSSVTESPTMTEEPANEAEDVTNKTTDVADDASDEDETDGDLEQAASEDVPARAPDAAENWEPTDQEVQESKIPEIDSEIEDEDIEDDDDENADESKIEQTTVVYEAASEATEDSDEEAEASEVDAHIVEVMKQHNNTENSQHEGQTSAANNTDGSVEYKLRLVDEMNETRTGRSRGKDGRKRVDRSRKMHRKQHRGRGRFPLRLPRRTNAIVTGLEHVRREGDVMIGDKDNTTTVIDAIIEMGPVEITMKGSAEPNLRKAKATTPPLQAKLRLAQRNGKLVSVLLKPVRMRPNAALVTVRRRNGQDMPLKQQSARVVTHLSQEMSRLWNSGYLLRRMGRRLKQTYKNDQAFLELVKKLMQQ